SVPPGDVTALVAAVTALLEDEDRRSALGAGARRIASERYAWPDIARRLLAVYERVLDHSPSSRPAVVDA
ncbi:MAG: glycosyltransferase, partial [Gaiellaceae bacterium]